MKDKNAPGAGNIPSEALKHCISKRPGLFLTIYNTSAQKGIFPKLWKRAKLVLLLLLLTTQDHKGLFFLDVEGKLYEQLILIKLTLEIERTGVWLP